MVARLTFYYLIISKASKWLSKEIAVQTEMKGEVSSILAARRQGNVPCLPQGDSEDESFS